MAIDYSTLALRLRNKLTAFIVDSNDNPILADYTDEDGNTRSRFVPANDPGRPKFPACFAHIPLVTTEDSVGKNPPLIHDIILTKEDTLLSSGTVDDIESTGGWAGQILTDYGTDFTNLDINNKPNQIRPGNYVKNTTTGKTTMARGMLLPEEEPDTVLVDDPIFESVGDSYEIWQSTADYVYWSGRLIDLRFQILDVHDPEDPWHDPRGTVNSIAEQMHDWFVAHADHELQGLCFMIDPLGNGIGSITEADMSLDEGTGESQRVYRRDFDVRLKHTKMPQREFEIVSRVDTEVDTTGPSSDNTDTGHSETYTVET